MPKISLKLHDAKAKDADILAKLGKVKQAAQGHKQQTKSNQQKLEYTEESRRLASEARRLEDDVEEMVRQLGFASELTEERHATETSIDDMWFQVAGVRQLLGQVKLRDTERLRKAPQQAVSLQGVLGSVSAALASLGRRLGEDAAELEQDTANSRRSLREDMAGAAGGWSSVAEKHGEVPDDLSEAEDAFLDQVGDSADVYGEDLLHLNDQIDKELAQLAHELADLRRKRASWNDESHFRFISIRRQFQGKNRDLLIDRLNLEFPHLSREQLAAHEVNTDALKFATQRQAAAFRQWRRSRLTLLRQAQARVEDRRRAEELLAVRRQDVLDQRAKQKRLQADLYVERSKASVRRDEQRRHDEQESRRLQAAEDQREEARRRHVNNTHEQNREHQERKREQRRQEAEDAAERAREEAVERGRRQEQNAKAVSVRRQMDEIKQRALAEQRKAAEQERREQEERLQRAMEKLKVEAPRDPERLLKEPARAQAAAYVEPLVCVTRGPHAGFDEKRLMADARYKISAALQAAGLYNTKAGHEMLARVPAPRPSNPTLQSNVFDGGYPH
eukprot:TRINITY_DN68987_c0_g1_i1.p1 TRINITY_DN68987_c0_g1~~TRINITY_DN68987_c0_g1_i1.p1  ORF type:complete len:563 (-),score=131.09 TRINITY_DN68987_c0_g1_i1:71-1759(-)